MNFFARALSDLPRQNGWHGRTGGNSRRPVLHGGNNNGQTNNFNERAHDGLATDGFEGPKSVVKA